MNVRSAGAESTMSAHHQLHVPHADASATIRLKESGRMALRESRAHGEITLERAHRWTPERHDALFLAFADDANRPRVQLDIAKLEPHELRDAQTRAVEHLQDGAIPDRGGILLLRGLHHLARGIDA